MRLVVWIVSVVTVFTSTVFAADQCTVVNLDPKKTQFLEKVKALNDKNFTVVAGNVTYRLKWCGEASTQPSKAAVVEIKQNKEKVIGRYNETDVITLGGWNIVTFAGGDVINSTNSRCNGTNWKAVVLMECHPQTDNFTLVDSMNAGCFAVFHLNTTALCGVAPTTPPPPAPPQEHTSRWTVFFMLILTAGICYIIIGMAYRRFVLGAKGFEQIPNYDFWRDPCGYTRDYCERRETRRNEPWTNSARRNDNVDEPLLHP